MGCSWRRGDMEGLSRGRKALCRRRRRRRRKRRGRRGRRRSGSGRMRRRGRRWMGSTEVVFALNQRSP